MIKKGVYAAALSILNEDLSLNVEATIAHANYLISSGLHGVIFFGSTGQSQLISLSEKKNLISKIGSHKLKKQFFIGTGSNSLKENINLIKYAMEYEFRDFLIMPPAYYKGNTDEGVFKFYSLIISAAPKIKIILYNFEKLSGYPILLNTSFNVKDKTIVLTPQDAMDTFLDTEMDILVMGNHIIYKK